MPYKDRVRQRAAEKKYRDNVSDEKKAQRNARVMLWAKKNKDKVYKSKRKWLDKNKEARREYEREYWEKNKETLNANKRTNYYKQSYGDHADAVIMLRKLEGVLRGKKIRIKE